MAKYENLSCLSKFSPHHRSRWPGPSCKYICNDKLNPIIRQAWALRSFHTRVLALACQPSKIIPAPLARVALKKRPCFQTYSKNVGVFPIFFLFFSFFSHYFSFSRSSLQQGRSSSQHSPRSCTFLNAHGARQRFRFQYDKLGLDFLIPQKKNWRVLGLLQKKSQAEIFPSWIQIWPRHQHWNVSASGFWQDQDFKAKFGAESTGRENNFFFSKQCPVINFFLNYLLAQRGFLLNEVDST